MSGPYRTDVTVAVADVLADAGVGDWNPDGVYGPQDTAITIAVVPANPTNVIALVAYPLSDDVSGDDGPGPAEDFGGDSLVGLQVRYRAGHDPRLVEALSDAGFGVLHDLTDVPFGSQGGRILLARRTTSAPLGPDESGRWEVADTYQLQIHRP